jgi:methyl-accepting chemotaxis protein
MPRLDDFKVSTRLAVIALLPLLALAALAFVSARQTRDTMLEEKKTATRHAVETAWSVLDHLHGLALAGAITDEQARRMAIAATRALKYEQKEYFWLNDMRPTMIMHPTKPELDGKDLSSVKDPTGQFIFQTMVKTVRESGAGFVGYLWPKPGATEPMPKISYVKAYAPWGWVVGSGIYVDEVDAAFRVALIRAAGELAIVGLLLVVSIWGISRSITTPLRRAVGYAARIGAGDLTTSIRVTGRDETAQLLDSLGRMQVNLRTTVGRIRDSVGSIGTAATEIAQGSADLAGRTASQAASLEETAASMEEITATVKQNAENALAANQLAASASQIAGRGADVVKQAVGAMGSIDDSAKKIVDIISVIDGIAFQTNILALNAAVEASRAGDQGRGFAVVASEVRSLAQRSSTAAKEIKALIDSSVTQVGQGRKLVDAAGSAMDEIQTAVRKVNELMAEIATASREQGTGIEQVAQAIGQIDDGTQQNAALVEQAAAAAESLRTQAGELDAAAAQFRIGDGHAQAADASRPPRVESASGTRRPAQVPAARSVPDRRAASVPYRKASGF